MKRIISLDVLRGMTVAGMIMVNNPAVWGSQYAPLKHADWNGLTPTDLVFPFFLFIMGVSAYFSLSRRILSGRRTAFIHVVSRSVLIFVVGLLLHLFSRLVAGTLTDFSSWRIMGVLQSLGIAFLFGSLIMLWTRSRHLLTVSIVLLAIYAVILILGDGFALSPDNVIVRVDRALMGDGHLIAQALPEGGRMPFEPEGILSTLPRVAHFLLGAFVGKMILEGKEDISSTMTQILLFGAVTLICGYLLQYGLPINKKIWSPSFALVTCGYACLMLGILIWIIDIKGRTCWTRFFIVFGRNPLFLYCFAWVLATLLRISVATPDGASSLKSLFYSTCIQPWCTESFGSLVYSVIFVTVSWLAGLPLFRKHIYIKL